MLIAVAMFALMDSVLKVLSTRYPSMQVASLRAITSFPLVCAYVGWRGGFRSVFQVRMPLHLLRGALGIVMLTLFVYGLQTLSLAQAYAIFFIAPALITALSMLILKERVNLRRWLAIVVCLAGVLVALRPSGEGMLTVGGLAILGSATAYAVSAISGRIVGRTDRSEHTVLWMIVYMGIGATVMAIPGWVFPRSSDFLLLFSLAVTGFLGQVAITEAFNSGEASVVAPFEYTALAYGMLLDWVLWHTLPDRYTVLGAAIIIGSGIYLIRHERDQT
ncbi:MAG: DMT family transporter [Gammaproteobacteria bacterium]